MGWLHGVVWLVQVVSTIVGPGLVEAMRPRDEVHVIRLLPASGSANFSPRRPSGSGASLSASTANTTPDASPGRAYLQHSAIVYPGREVRRSLSSPISGLAA